MTKAQDKAAVEANTMAVETAKAAALVKATAESTATALNIQYIQKDILEIKDGIKSLTTNQDNKLEDQQKQITGLQKQQWAIGGAATILAFIIPLFLKFFVK